MPQSTLAAVLDYLGKTCAATELESLSDEDLEKYVSVLDKLREGPTVPEPTKGKRGH